MTSVSPLFAVEADALFAEGRLDEALELCRAGISTFPEYAAAYVLASRILSSLGRANEVTAVIKQGFAQSRRNEALRRIAEELGINTYSLTSHEGASTFSDEEAQLTEKRQKDAENLYYAPQIDGNHTKNMAVPIQLKRIGAKRVNYKQPLKWHANDLSLIPGLNFSFSRIEGRPQFPAIVLCRPNFPPFPEMCRRIASDYSTTVASEIDFEIIESASEKNCTPLEELAQRLERARIPVPREESGAGAADNATVPEFVTDTMAAIYERQGALAQALKAYQILARNKPENLPLYQAKINEITLKIKN